MCTFSDASKNDDDNHDDISYVASNAKRQVDMLIGS